MMRNERGFTLIELVIVIIILGIMAALAIPKFFNISVDAKKSATQGALGGVRSAVANYNAKNLVANPADATPYPNDVTELQGAMDGSIPDNPNCVTGTCGPDKKKVVMATGVKGTVSCNTVSPDVTAAWCYKVTQPGGPGEFWAATNAILAADGGPESGW